ncbi:MAG: hypothetical protein E7604_03265 [Ruminococcaceae bacterium]|nr:hypothetical protein [Oscillospiraceae bacterium]
MDKGLLFQFMRVKFREAGFPPAEVELHMQSFTERYQNQTDEEIEADIRRRGGPTRIAAATIERRNTVLMADPDYRAFVSSSAAQTDAADSTDVQAPAKASAAASDAAPADEKPAEMQPSAEQPAEAVGAEKDDEDPFAAWFASADIKKEEDDLPPLFADTAQKKQETPVQVPARAVTAEVSVVKPAPQAQTVHSIPLFAEGPQKAAPTAQTVPRPAAEADLGRTRVVRVPAQERTAAPKPVPQNQEAGAPAAAYQQEQQAIWGAASGVRDQRGPASRPAQPAHPVQQERMNRTDRPAQTRKAPRDRVEYSDRGTVTRLQEKTYWGEGSEEGVKRFRIVLAVSIPFVIVLLLAYAVMALGLIALMAVLIAAFIAGLVVEVAVGSLIALVAVIYGISQLFLVLPVGMFELGLGVAAIGITMFVGILMYNIAVRLLPFLLRKFIGFQSVFRVFLQDLYYYVKGECYRR